MPIAEARVATGRADRYLTQLADHLGHLRRGSIAARHAPMPQAGSRGEFVFDWGTCTLVALDDTLVIRLEADDSAALERARDQIGRRIETIGRREQLTVTWRDEGAHRPTGTVSEAGSDGVDETVTELPGGVSDW